MASHSYLRKASLQVRQLLHKLEPDCQRPQLLVVHRAPSQTHRPHCGVSNTVVAVGATVLGDQHGGVVQPSQRAAPVRHCVCQHVSERQFRQKVPCRLRPAEPCLALSIGRSPPGGKHPPLKSYHIKLLVALRCGEGGVCAPVSSHSGFSVLLSADKSFH